MNAVQFSNYCVQELLASYAPVACCLCIEKNPVYRKKPYGNTKTCHNLYYNFFSLPDFTKYGTLCQSNFIHTSAIWWHQIVTSHFMISFLLLPHIFFKGTQGTQKPYFSYIIIRCYLAGFMSPF